MKTARVAGAIALVVALVGTVLTSGSASASVTEGGLFLQGQTTTITGTVTSDQGQAVLAGIQICGGGPAGSACATSGADGSYTLDVPDGGDYSIEFSDPIGNHVTEYYDDTTPDNPTLVTVATGASIGGIDAELALGGTVSGAISGPTGVSLDELSICVNSNQLSTCEFSVNSSSYIVPKIPPGTYTVNIVSTTQQTIEEYWDDATFDTAATIVVTAGQDTGNINFDLELASRISGEVLDPGGSPVQDVSICATETTTFEVGCTTSQPDGSYDLGGLQGGTYTLESLATFDFLATTHPTLVTVGAGAESAGNDITLTAAPTGTQLVEPIDPANPVGPSPLFIWTADQQAIQYRIWIQSQTGGGVVFDETVDALMFFCDIECFAELPTPLADDRYSWWIRPIQAGGPQDWSDEGEFVVGFPPVQPGQVGAIAPSGPDHDNDLDFVWQEDANASEYRFWLQSSTGAGLIQDITIPIANLACDGTTCTYTYNALADGEYEWWVRAQSPAGNAPWSDSLEFAVGAPVPKPGTPSILAPIGGPNPTNPTVVWSETANATTYEIYLRDFDSPTIVQQTDLTVGQSVTCTAGQCSHTLQNVTLDGSYKLWVRAKNGSVVGDWSSGVSFYAGSLSAPATATPLSPDGAAAGANPTYQWTPAADATWYYVWVQDTTGTIVQRWYKADDVGCGAGTCTITPSETVTGNATWWVRSWNLAGFSEWSSGQDFSA